MQTTRWIARWTDHQGNEREWTFTGSQKRSVARIDFVRRLGAYEIPAQRGRGKGARNL
jgi:hypothetical protein